MLRKTSIRVLAVLTAVLLWWPASSAAKAAYPDRRGAVNDFAGVLSAAETAQMERLAAELWEKTGTAVVVAVMETIGAEDADEFANRLYERWGIGRKGQDKGVLIFLTIRERRVRIETGYGVEGILPDGLVGELIDRYGLPYLRQGRYGQGLLSLMAAVAAVVAKAEGVTLSGAPKAQRRSPPPAEEPSFLQLVLLAAVIFFLLGTRQGRQVLPWLLMLMMSGGGRRGGGGFGGFGGGFGGFGGGMSGGGGASRGF